MTQLTTVERRTYNNIDLCKIVMSIFVVAIHTNPLVNCSNKIALTLYGLVVRMAVPFFFLSSGYLLASRFDPLDKNVNISIVRNHLAKISKLYLVWSTIYFPLAVYDYYSSGVSLFYAIASYARGLLIIGEHYNSWHLWYLLSTIYALILVMSVLRANTNRPKWYVIIGLVFLLSIFMDEIVKYSGALPMILHLVRAVISYTTINGRILQGAFFIPIGMLMKKNMFSLKQYVLLFAISFGTNYFVENTAISSILLYFSAITFFGIVLHIELKDHICYPILRRLSADIYLVHMYIWTIYYTIVHGEKRFGWDCFVITTVASLIIGLIRVNYNRNKNIVTHVHITRER